MDRSRAFDATIGIGSNVGDKRSNIARAIELLTADGRVRLLKRSRDYRSPPWGVREQDWFVNACIAVATNLPARTLLQHCQEVERKMGRVRMHKWGPRLIDLDVLTYRDEIIAEADLIVPHPLIAERAFVLLPLSEIAPELRINGLKLSAMLAEVDATDCVPIESEP